MSYKKISLSITISLLLGTIASAQSNTQESSEFTPNTIIAYFSEDGTLLPTRDDSSYYRYFKDIISGCYLVQDFYSKNDQKQTDPICFTDPSELQSWFPQSMQGPLRFWSINGQKTQEGYSQQDGGNSGFWKSWDDQGNANNYELINGEVIISYFDKDGNRYTSPIAGGTFRTLLDQNPDNGEYLISDYFTDSRTRQMDPVVIKQDDLLRWDIQFRSGGYVYYNPQGNITTLEEYNSMGLLDGSVTNWYEHIYPAQKFDEINFNDGQQEGLYVRWYANGYPKIKMIIADNTIQSTECWNENFQALREDQCENLLDEDFNASLYDDTAGLPTDDIEQENYAAKAEVQYDINEPIEIIIPDDAVEQEHLDDTATVIFPQDDEIDEIYFEELEEIDAIEENSQYDNESEGQKIFRSIKNILNSL